MFCVCFLYKKNNSYHQKTTTKYVFLELQMKSLMARELGQFLLNILTFLLHCLMIISLSSVCFANSVFLTKNVSQFDCY